MSGVILCQEREFHGYSITIDGEISPENGQFNFLSVIVGPLTELIVYDRKNDIFTAHNGTRDIGLINDISTLMSTINPETILNVKVIELDREDGSTFIKNSVSGDTIPLPIRKSHQSSILVTLILLLILFIGAVFLIKFIMKRNLENEIAKISSQNMSSDTPNNIENQSDDNVEN